MGIRLFISYSRDDKHWTYDLRRHLLEETDHDVWIDRRLQASADWWETILSEIERCDCLLYVLSPKSVQSIYCREEVRYALALNKPILPLLIKPCDYPFELNQQRVQYQNLTETANIDRVTRIIESAIVKILQDKYVSGKYQPRPASRPAEPQKQTNEVDTPQNDAKVQASVGATHQTPPATSVGTRHAVSETPPAPTPVKPRAIDLLPAPFAWCSVPAGKVLLVPDDSDKKNSYLKQDTWFDVPAFQMGKYPITNGQYAKFLQAGGYEQKSWWTADGWQQRQKEGWTQPRYWADSKWNGAEQPVVGVSWYESVAFCLWLSETTGEQIMLPTEQQWQRAAQGDEGRIYPWGKGWDAKRCNTKESGIGKTTPVRQYEGKGDSPFGVVDMAGNVWEWCLTDYYSGNQDINSQAISRGLRGGSWDYFSSFARAVYRLNSLPYYWYDYRGFRVVLLIS